MFISPVSLKTTLQQGFFFAFIRKSRYFYLFWSFLYPMSSTVADTQFSSFQSFTRVWLFATPWPAARQASHPSPTPGACSNSCPLSWWYHPTISSSVVPFCSAFNLSQHESVLCIRWPKYWSFSISPFGEYARLVFFRTSWLDLLAVQGTLRSLLQHHSLKASILWCSAFFMVQLLHPYMTIGKTIVFTRWTLVCKVIFSRHSINVFFNEWISNRVYDYTYLELWLHLIEFHKHLPDLILY